MFVNTLALFTIFFALILQIPIGIYQMLSSGIHLLSRNTDPKVRYWRMWHFFGSLTYVITFLPWMNVQMESWGALTFFVIPQGIAYAYFILTVKDFNIQKERIDMIASSEIEFERGV